MPPALFACRRLVRARLTRALMAVVAAALLGIVCVPSEASEASPAQAFTAFETAWESASAKQVIALMAPKGTLRVRLLKPRNAGGSWTLDQAKRGLTTYFGEKGVSKPALKDVTPRTNRRKTVRVFDYSYRPHGGDSQATRLTVEVKQDADKNWVLASVIESPRPRR